MKTRFYTISLLALATSAGAVLAHGPGGASPPFAVTGTSSRANAATPPRPEPVVKREPPPQMEISIEGQTVFLKITDADGRPVDAELAYAKSFITAAGKISTLYLWPTGVNVLSGTGDFLPEPGMRVEVRLNLPDREPVNKDFYPLK